MPKLIQLMKVLSLSRKKETPCKNDMNKRFKDLTRIEHVPAANAGRQRPNCLRYLGLACKAHCIQSLTCVPVTGCPKFTCVTNLPSC